MHPRIIAAMPRNARERACFLHGGQAHGRLVATGIDIDYEGQLVACEGCLGQLAALIDWISPEKARELEEQNANLRRANEELIDKAGKHARLVAALEDAGLAGDSFEGVPV